MMQTDFSCEKNDIYNKSTRILEKRNAMEREKQYADNMKRQWMIFETLGRDFVNLGLINIKRKTASVLTTTFGNEGDEYADGAEIPYYEMCQKSMAGTVKESEKASLMEKIKLEKIIEELAEKEEYSFVFEAHANGEPHTCLMKYMSMDDQEHILMAFRFVDDIVRKEKEKYDDHDKKKSEELSKERMFLEILCRDYTSVFYVDLKSEDIEVLKVDSNANAAKLFGSTFQKKLQYSTEIKRYCEAYVVKEDRDEFLKIMNKVSIAEKLSHTDRVTYRYQSVPNESGHHYFEVQVVRTEDKKFDNTAILAFRHIDDIIEQEKERQKEIQAKHTAERNAKISEEGRQAAVAANEMKSRFLSSLSHDIRTPVNGIQGILRIADAYPDDLKKQNECREKLWIASDYLVSLVNNVLDMKRLESQAVTLSEKSFDLIDLLMGTTALTDMQIEAQGLHLIVDWKPEYIKHRHLIGSAEGLTRILMNLNSNAIKYNKKNGSLYCRCMEKECDGDKAWFEMITSDTGIGMDEEFLKHAFEPYAQKNNTSLNSINGVGLGLSIVKQTVELMGGTLTVESKLNEGTKYTILLPFKIDHHPVQEKKEMKLLSLEGVKALLVEDNNLNMEIAKFCLEQEHVEVFSAVNGQEAVEMFEHSEPGFFDVILMDISMPIMDGLEATRQIRSLNRTDSLTVPIIAMSANAFEEDIEKSLQAGMNEHLVKPLDGQKLAETMKKYLSDKIEK